MLQFLCTLKRCLSSLFTNTAFPKANVQKFSKINRQILAQLIVILRKGGFRYSYHIQSNARMTFDNGLKLMRKGTLS
jgi:hypothetical protein